MISILRPKKLATLDPKGVPAAKALMAAFKADPKTVLQFQKRIFRSTEVRAELSAAQYGKCAFCECHISHNQPGDIEHFRPKAGYKQAATDKGHKTPGYFWLAYTWENLLLSCTRCNNQKGNWFPLADPSKRARPTRKSLSKERPLLVDPTSQKPEQFVRFNEHIAYPVGDCLEGKTTIDVLDLNRTSGDGRTKDVADRREEFFLRLRATWENLQRADLLATRRDDSELTEIRKALNSELRASYHPSAEYSAMARDYLIAVNFV